MKVLGEIRIDSEDDDNRLNLSIDDDDDDDDDYDDSMSNRPRHKHKRQSANRGRRGRNGGRKSLSKLVLSDDDDDDEDSEHEDEDEDYDTAMGITKKKPRKSKICFAGDDSDDDDEYLSPLEHDKENDENGTRKDKRKNHPDSIQKTKDRRRLSSRNHDRDRRRSSFGNNNNNHKRTPNPKPKKKRRRSSARFLRLSGRFGGGAGGGGGGHGAGYGNGNDDDDEDEVMMNAAEREEQQKKLGEMYQKAIRLNAENKINAGNSWGLNLIENIDKFLGDDDDDDDDDGDGVSHSRSGNDNENVNDDGVVDMNNGNTKDRGQKGSSTSGKGKRVNFTKASCTLDASVKIYAHRVDDVYLTSYKVLANLNRTDGGGNRSEMNGGGDMDGNGGMDGRGDFEEGGGRGNTRSNARRRGSVAAVKTVETNLANLNISKIDSAYDIDPIFHKMSRKFDEGGAKGLLLVNLGVADDGCRIVLDSKEFSNGDSAGIGDDSQVDGGEEPVLLQETDGSEIEKNSLNKCNDDNDDMPPEEGMVDITCLTRILRDAMGSKPLDSFQIAPQLEELRDSYDKLEEEGFIDAGKALKPKSMRYANDAEEEKAAEEVIHREALERSTASGLQMRTSFLMPNTSILVASSSVSSTPPSESYENDGPIDFGGIGGDYDGGDDIDSVHGDGIGDVDNVGDDTPFQNILAMDEYTDKFSSQSFQNDMTQDGGYRNSCSSTFLSNDENNGNPQSVTFLDEICAGDVLTQGSQYSYFNKAALDKLTSGNQWAGSAHWKKNATPRKPKRDTSKGLGGEADTRTGAKKTRRKDQKRARNKKDEQERALVNLSACDNHLQALLKSKKITRGKKNTKIDAFQMSATVRQKNGKERNMLPRDAGLDVSQFHKFFMRPDANLTKSSRDETSSRDERKSVGFLGINTEYFDDGIDDVDYDDGPGFELNEHQGNDDLGHDDNFQIKELEGIRKVEKVRVSHATIAKKVDVKRLKNDLWTELEVSTASASTLNASKDIAVNGVQDGSDEEDAENEAEAGEKSSGETDETSLSNNDTKVVSFKDTVDKLGATQAQEDVSLAFYFICVLHLANEKGLKLENGEFGLTDFKISRDGDAALPPNN